MMLAKTVLFVFGICVGCCSAADWSYAGSTDGTSHWKSHFPVCGGSKQSPINIKPASAAIKVYGEPTLEHYDETPNEKSYILTNNGHTIQLNVNGSTTSMTLKDAGLDGTYKLAQFHLHWGSTDCLGSEHTVEGLHYPAELHLVHYNTKYDSITAALDHDDGLAVLGVMIDIGEVANPSFDKLTEAMQTCKYAESRKEVEPFEMKTLLPSNRKDFVRYQGSLTTPPCLEIVTWTVFKEALEISQTQINALRAVSHNKKGQVHDHPLVNNYRPTLPINSRKVYKTYTAGDRPTTKACFEAVHGAHASTIKSSLVYVSVAALLIVVKNMISGRC